MTEQLYYQNVYLRECTAMVRTCYKEKDRYAAVLDRTVFYPEGGGQPYDTGTLGDAKVLEVHKKDGEIVHYLDRPLEEGKEVTAEINWERRFDLMQQHSGEHMVSGIVHEKYGYDNVGFHMGSDVITIDFNGILTEEQLGEVENLVNQKVWENRNVEITYPSEEELRTLPYRSKKELTGEIRIVNIPETDLCACCGLHVTHTGEVGMVKLLSVQKFRQGVRVEMICGNRVLSYLNEINTQNKEISVLLSAHPAKTAAAVKRLWEENFQNKGKVISLEERVFQNEAESLKGAGNTLIWEEGLESDSVRKLTDAVMHTCQGLCAVFSGQEDGSFKYAVGEEGGDLRVFIKEMNQALQGKGGGKPFFAQGFVQASKEEIEEFFRKLSPTVCGSKK